MADVRQAEPDVQPGSDMVRIPGGTFLMGSDDHYPEEAPAHKVTVDGFWIDRHPVTNAEFARFVRSEIEDSARIAQAAGIKAQ